MKNNDLIQVVFTPQEKVTAQQTLRTLQKIIASKAPAHGDLPTIAISKPSIYNPAKIQKSE